MLKYIALLAFLAGIFGLLHQRFFTSMGWFDWGTIWKHEVGILAMFSIGVGLVIWIYWR